MNEPRAVSDAQHVPRRRVRRVLSVAIVAHFVAIAVAVTSYSSPNFPAPVLAVRASTMFQPYLQLTFLNNAYRFFAPNPGTPIIFWFRVQYQDGRVHWRELPGRAQPLWRAPYQRRLNLSVQLGQQLAFVSDEKDRKMLAPLGKVLLESAVRHVARTAAEQPVASGVATVGVYSVFHTIVTPAEVRDGWTPTDLRTYRPVFVGAYTPTGERIDEFQPTVVDQSIAYVAAGIVAVDVRPSMAHGRDAATTIASLGLPDPITLFLLRHPELLDSSPDENLERRIEALLPPRR